MVVTSTVVNEVAARAIFPVKIVWQADPTTSREFDSPYRLGAWVEFLSETEFADTSCTDFRGRQLNVRIEMCDVILCSVVEGNREWKWFSGEAPTIFAIEFGGGMALRSISGTATGFQERASSGRGRHGLSSFPSDWAEQVVLRNLVPRDELTKVGRLDQLWDDLAGEV